MPSSVLLGVWSSPLQDEAGNHTLSECPNGAEGVSTDPLCLCTLKLSTWSSRGCSRLFGLPVIPGGATAEMRNQHQWPHRCDWFRRINWLLYRFACTCQGRSHEEEQETQQLLCLTLLRVQQAVRASKICRSCSAYL